MKPTQKAFSMIELITAIAVITVGFMAVFDLLSANLQQTHQVEQHRIALAAAGSEIESLRAMEFGRLVPQEKGAFLAPMPMLAQLNDGRAELTIRAREPRLKEVVVTVRWTAGRLGTRQVTLSTLIFNPAP